jgi:DNA-binding response OmpR family regulator
MDSEPSHKFARVLIVEDDEMQAQILRQGLATAGFKVDIVSSGLAAVRMVEERHYDAVLVDYTIPEIDGLATARLLGDFLGPIARPVLIALTATPENLIAKEAGAKSAFDLVLDKSCDLATIIAAIAQCLAGAPDAALKQAAKDRINDQAEEDHAMGPRRLGGEDGDSGPARILIAEDDESQQLLLRSILEKRGYVVETTSDGLQAIRRIRENWCDLVIVDYNLPGIDGLAVGSLVHDQMAQAWRPRLIGLTATPDLVNDRTMVTGPVFDQLLGKSSGLHELIHSIDHLLRSSPNPDTRRAAARALAVEREAAFSLM